MIIADVINQPILIKKNVTQLFIVYFNVVYIIYLYNLGVATPTLLSSPNFPDETIKKIIAKFWHYLL